MNPPSHEWRVTLLALVAGLPATILLIVQIWSTSTEAKIRWTAAIVLVIWWLGFALAVRGQVARPLQTMSNLLGALREGDYSIRARDAAPEEPLGLAMKEANALAQILREQRLDMLEATVLLRKVMEEIDVAIFAFDGGRVLRLVNRAGVRMMGHPAVRLIGRTSGEVGLDQWLGGPPRRTVEASFPGGKGRWEVRRSKFRQGGLNHQLLVIADLSRTLREEETLAWQRLIRVLGHEINNSLAPIKSITASMSDLLGRGERPADWEEDLARGLEVVGGRADALSRFMSAYARLTSLPPPALADVDVEAWIHRVASLETRLGVVVVPGTPVTIAADGDQLDQLLINLVHNAADASLERSAAVETGWEVMEGELRVWVRDGGPGISDTANLFVPFFTTKQEGTGIGLTLSRQIAEAHGGTLTLENREDAAGCIARLSLPLPGD